MRKIKIPFYLFIVSIFVTSVVTILIFVGIGKKTVQAATVNTSVAGTVPCDYHITRRNGYKFISPVLFAEPECESEGMIAVKEQIEQVIYVSKTNGELVSASVYLREFNEGKWMSINDTERYSPGSLLKVPIMMTCLKMDEQHPGFLNKKIPYNTKINDPRSPTILSKSIEVGHAYTVKELLKYMVTYSDNQATYLLYYNVINKGVYDSMFTDLGGEAPVEENLLWAISANEYSKFMKVLYDASYLTISDSEYCLELLSTCEFNDGIVAGMPKGTKIAHKFGEGGTFDEHTFCESGIIFVNNDPYILTIMTKGSELAKLPKVVARISEVVYQNMK